MMLIALALLSVGLVFAEEIKKLDRCEIEFKKCEYECAVKYPTNKKKQDGCRMRCSANKAYCETGEALKKAGKEIKDFLEGLLGYESE